MLSPLRLIKLVALRKESVDRNVRIMSVLNGLKPSLSARRAWIEIFTGTYHTHFHASLSARRAWIEISPSMARTSIVPVALRKESVDRNPYKGGQGEN